MPYNPKKVILGFSNVRLGEWLHGIKGHAAFAITEPVGLYVSFRFSDRSNLKKANLMGYLKEITATLVFEKVLKNTQQIAEIGVEKKHGEKNEVNIFLCKQ